MQGRCYPRHDANAQLGDGVKEVVDRRAHNREQNRRA
jgi:hypothetical protein